LKLNNFKFCSKKEGRSYLDLTLIFGYKGQLIYGDRLGLPISS
jgi:hypothetical protein